MFFYFLFRVFDGLSLSLLFGFQENELNLLLYRQSRKKETQTNQEATNSRFNQMHQRFDLTTTNQTSSRDGILNITIFMYNLFFFWLEWRTGDDNINFPIDESEQKLPPAGWREMSAYLMGYIPFTVLVCFSFFFMGETDVQLPRIPFLSSFFFSPVKFFV